MEPKGTYPVINTLASKKQIKCHYEIKEAGKQQFKEYWNKTVVNNTSAISDTIMNNKFETFSTYKPKSPSRLNQKLKLVTNNVGLFHVSSSLVKLEMVTLTHSHPHRYQKMGN